MFDRMDLYEAVAIAISNIAVKQGKEECIDEVFSIYSMETFVMLLMVC